MESFSGVIHLAEKRYLHYIRKILRFMMDVKSRNYCRDLFKRLEILTLPCEYIFSLINFIINNKHLQTNADVHSVNTGTITINQLLTSHVFRKEHIMLGSKFSKICHLISIKKHDLK
jgi:hypothetical protein